MKIKLIFIGLFLCSTLFAQDRIMIDQVVAIIGNKIVKHSDVEAQISQMRVQGEFVDESSYCQILEQLMISKLFEHQAELDSITIPDSEVEANLDRRIRYFVQQIGSREKLEEFYNKPIIAIKEEFRDMIRSQMVSNQMESQITEDVRVTPSEVRRFFNGMHPDSIPLIPTEFEIYQIIKKPVISKEEKDAVRNRLSGFRNRILQGERFATLATMFSECPSSRNGGELGMFGRGDMHAEFEATAFSLKDGEISPIIETPFGFHIIQLIERQGENANVRHILLKPKPNVEDLAQTQQFLDSVAKLIRDSVHTFQQAAELFSEDPSGRVGGLYTGPYSGNARVTAEEMDPTIFFIIDNFEEGQISNAAFFTTEDNEQAVRILKLDNRIAPHQANLEQDYDKIFNMAMMEARQTRMSEWLNQRLRTQYVRLNSKAKECTFNYNWGQ
ncbi:MAG: peptidylprolyl isomerase [Bacteroidales bacterium]|nr:peptidylprolyl isomerase [Bacteroidales bacterium]